MQLPNDQRAQHNSQGWTEEGAHMSAHEHEQGERTALQTKSNVY